MNLEKTPRRLDRLTVFTFLWACQALVHQEFFIHDWVDAGDPWGWLVTGFAVAALLFPRSLTLLSGMLLTSIAFSFVRWPHVSNHILVESLFHFAILGAIVMVLVRRSSEPVRERILDQFAPVLRVSLVVMYFYAILAKFNSGFFDLEESCVVKMYEDDLRRRFPFVPSANWAYLSAIWGTVVIEILIPVLLTFRRTQWMAIAIGIPFHFMLGLIGYRSFSSLAYAVYGLFLITPLTEQMERTGNQLLERFGKATLTWARGLTSVVVVVVVGGLIVARWTGNYKAEIGPLKIEQIGWLGWILFCGVVAWMYGLAIWKLLQIQQPAILPRTQARPGWLWVVAVIVFLNGTSQYLGFKTETCFTMYSNLRTEGDVYNHYLVPRIRLANYQDDLVEVIATSHPELRSDFVEGEFLSTFFEFKRIVSTTREDFWVVFERGGEQQRFELRDGQPSDPELYQPIPFWKSKLLRFRKVPKDPERCPCQH